MKYFLVLILEEKARNWVLMREIVSFFIVMSFQYRNLRSLMGSSIWNSSHKFHFTCRCSFLLVPFQIRGNDREKNKGSKSLVWLHFTSSQVTDYTLKCIWQIFLFARSDLPNVLISIAKKIFDSDFPSPVLMYQKRQISLPVGYKTARPKTGDWERFWRHFRTPGLAKNRFLSHFLIVS